MSVETGSRGVTTVAEAILENARRGDGEEFLRLLFSAEPDATLSYPQLVQEAARWTRFYDDQGVRAGDRVVVVLPHSLDLYAAYLGALLGGVVPAMLNFPSPKFSEEAYFGYVGTVLESTRARLLVTYPELRARLRERAGAAIGEAAVVMPGDVSSAHGPVPDPPDVDPEAPAFLQFSSGTTGVKKGVAVSHRALLWQVRVYADAIGAGADDRIVSWLPLYHDMGLITCFFQPLLRRVPLVAISPFDWVKRPASWLAAVSDHRGTLGWLPNFAYAFMATRVVDHELEGVDLESLRGLVNCSEPIREASHAAFVERFSGYGFRPEALAASYAMAENTFAVTSGGFGEQLRLDELDGRVNVSSGRPLPETEVAVRDAEGRLLPDRQIGEIVLRSPSLMSGYDGRPDASAEAFDADGFYLTGDLGYLADGHLFVTGRRQDLIIVGGRNVYPEDIEAIANTVDGVLAGRAVAFGVPDERLGTEAVVVVAESPAVGTAAEGELRRALFTAVAEQSEVVLSDVRIVEPRSLLKSSAGKLARAANREGYLASLPRRAATGAGRLPGLETVESTVRGIVARLVHVPPSDDDAPLITSGLIDSFALAELFEGLELQLGLSIPTALLDIDRFDSVRRIVETVGLVRAEGYGAREAAVAVGDGPVPMLYGTHAATRSRLHVRSMLARLGLELRGIRCGRGLRVEGRLLLQIDGRGRNVSVGRNVTLMPGVHLKNREEGRIVLHDGVKLDTNVRLVAARDARIEIGENTALGIGTVVNAGRDVVIGRGCLTGAHCVINASDHGLAAGLPIQEQPFDHAPITIGEDVWLGAHVVVTKGSRIGGGAVVSAGSIVSGDIPANAIAGGRPARVLRFRS